MARITVPARVRTILHVATLQVLLFSQVGLTAYLARTSFPTQMEEQVTMRIAPPTDHAAPAAPMVMSARSELLPEALRFTQPFEGRRSKAYLDSTGNVTIGVGFNLDRMNAERDLRATLGDIDVDALRDGYKRLSEAQIDALYRRDMQASIERARREVKGFDGLPREVQLIVVDMEFNLGSLAKWPRFRAALERRDFAAAAEQMAGSRWASQTGKRARAHIAAMKRAATAAGETVASR